ncbi:hypothetical protein Leryth_001458 [Lithospermum erythrorhizon]|nr:hypothetical protein Leryth_001458 [Lithospermum erythrorhizon]
MARTRLRRAIEAVKDQSSIGLAKVNHLTSLLSDLDVAIVRATNHDEYPAEERHILTILNLTCYSTPYVTSCVKTISKRLRKTRNWVVALKSLMLIHRLLHDGDVAFEQEFFFSSRYATCLFDMSDFRDTSCVDSWDYSIFVRTYASYLNDHLGHMVQGRKGKHGHVYTCCNEVREKVKPGAIVVRIMPVKEMAMEQIFPRIHCLMQTLELFLNCRPIGSAKTNTLVVVALYPLIKESFNLYKDITDIIDVMMERFMELDHPESLKVLEILHSISKQLDELDAFYNWSVSRGIARCSDYPEDVKIPSMKLVEMEDYVQKKYTEKDESEAQQDMNSIKAFPPPEGFLEENEVKIHEVGDLINLDDDDDDVAVTEEHPDKLALNLIDGPPATEPSPWEAFDHCVDWETELEQSANHLSSQKEIATGDFYTMMPDYGMHQQGAVNHEAGSAGSLGVPEMLALPAPPAQNAAANTTIFYPYYPAPMAITSPHYVQISEMEMKQRLETEQQLMWQQYARDGMHGQIAYAMIQPQPYMYNQGGYTTTY